MKKLLALMLMFTFAIVLAGCGDKTVKPEILINGPKQVKVNEVIKLEVTITPADYDQGVTYESVRPDVASVNSKGEVKGMKIGKTTIKVISTKDPTVTKTQNIQVLDATDEVRPDLGGYTITIAQAAHAIKETDPFDDGYVGQNKIAKRSAWDWVEKAYNVNIEVAAYPNDAEWGAPRWTYIEQQAAAGKAAFDFYTVPDSQIGRFVEANALIDVTDWYIKHGKGYMDATYKSSGTYKNSIYSITDGESGIYNVMYYNIGLFEKLGMEKSPAQIFNEGDWTFTKFKEFALQAQAQLNAFSTDEKPYFAVAGNSPYYWTGMSNAGGVKLANVNTLKMDLKNQVAIDAADTLKAIKAGGAMDPARSVDEKVMSWMDGRALFNSGDLWFINTANRWKENQWGEGEATRYGYVPFPRPDGISKDEQSIGLGGTATWVMPVGRDYSGYTAELTAENIYRAIVDTFIKTEEFQKADPNYNEEALIEASAQRYAESPESVQAFIYMSTRTKTVGFFDPLSVPDNPVANTGSGADLSKAINDYIMGTIDTFAGSVDPLIPLLEEKLAKAFS